MRQVLAGVFCWLSLWSHAQTPGRYLVQFQNKSNNPFSLSAPQAFLSERSLGRRARYHILLDSTDLPVTPAYIDSLRNIPGLAVLNASKWMNQVSVQVTDDAALARLGQLAFVQQTIYIAPKNQKNPAWTGNGVIAQIAASGAQAATQTTEDRFNYGSAATQVQLHQGAFLHNLGLQGQTQIISLLDAGFYHYNS